MNRIVPVQNKMPTRTYVFIYEKKVDGIIYKQSKQKLENNDNNSQTTL